VGEIKMMIIKVLMLLCVVNFGIACLKKNVSAICGWACAFLANLGSLLS
jgi:hypothetical protein